MASDATSRSGRTGPLAAGLAFVALFGAATAALHVRANLDSAPPARDPLPVATLGVGRVSGYTVTERFAGRLEPNRATGLAFELGGTVATLAFDEGDRVPASAVVARLDTASLEARAAALAASARETDARLQRARLALERVTRLRRAGHAADEAFDEARLTVTELEATRARVAAERRAVAVDLEKSVLQAPYAGRVAARHVDDGAVVAPGTPVLELVEDGARRARVGVSVAAAAEFAPGAHYALQVNGDEIMAELIALRPDLATGTRTVTALFRVPAPDGAPLGDVVTLAVERRVDAAGFWVPVGALSEDWRGLWSLYTVRDGGDGEAARVGRESVELLHTRDGQAFVRGTLGDGERIVAEGTHRVTRGQAVLPMPVDG